MNASDLTFGVELETTIPMGAIPVGNYHGTTQAQGLPEGWRAMHDGSIRGRDGRDVLNSSRKYKPDVLRAVRAFKRAKPWTGTASEIRDKYLALHAELCRIYAKRTTLAFEPSAVGSSFYIHDFDKIVLVGRPSVVTYLHEFGHALGKDERQTCAWSLNLFRRVFPRNFARCEFQGHMLLRPVNSRSAPLPAAADPADRTTADRTSARPRRRRTSSRPETPRRQTSPSGRIGRTDTPPESDRPRDPKSRPTVRALAGT
jgi:hypothetical protein